MTLEAIRWQDSKLERLHRNMPRAAPIAIESLLHGPDVMEFPAGERLRSLLAIAEHGYYDGLSDTWKICTIHQARQASRIWLVKKGLNLLPNGSVIRIPFGYGFGREWIAEFSLK